MYDGGKIVAGLVIFAILLTFPIWYSVASGSSAAPPELTYPEGAEACIESTQYMRDSHMQLLNGWRDEVVRSGERFYTDVGGERVERSLTNTCLGCHTDREQFCDRCHDYVDVNPYCWDCHLDPKGN